MSSNSLVIDPLDSTDLILKLRRDATGRCPTRSMTTKEHYCVTWLQFVAQANVPRDIDAVDQLRCVTRWFSEQSGRWKQSVVRHHRAVIFWAVEQLAFGGELAIKDVEYLTALLKKPLAPKAGVARPQTSANKRKGITATEHRRLVEYLAQRKTRTRLRTR